MSPNPHPSMHHVHAPLVLTESYRIYTSYASSSPPTPPPVGWTRFVLISDTHSHTFPVPAGDVLLHAGDLSHSGRAHQLATTIDWIRAMPHRCKVLVAGNHDFCLVTDWSRQPNAATFGNLTEGENAEAMRMVRGREAQDAGIMYLEDESYAFQGREGGNKWSVYGSPWQPIFGGWAWNYQRGAEAEAICAKIPKTDILISHGPPYGIQDVVHSGEHVGCEALLARIAQVRPRLHIVGHIHEHHGVTVKRWPDTGEETIVVNAANAGPRGFGGEGYQPVIVDLKDAMGGPISFEGGAAFLECAVGLRTFPLHGSL